MEKVEAWKDNNGYLHKTRREAVESDFISILQVTWGKMPDQRDRGDPVVIGRILAAKTYAASRKALMEAMLFLEEQLGEEAR